MYRTGGCRSIYFKCVLVNKLISLIFLYLQIRGVVGGIREENVVYRVTVATGGYLVYEGGGRDVWSW